MAGERVCRAGWRITPQSAVALPAVALPKVVLPAAVL
jgi:hypothetical protein